MIFGTTYELFLPTYQITFFLAFGQAKIFFSYQILMNILIYILFCDKKISYSAGDTGGGRGWGGEGRGGMALTFLCSKKKKWKQKKKERVSKQKLLKGCHQGQNVIAIAVLERLQFKNISCRPTMVAERNF